MNIAILRMVLGHIFARATFFSPSYAEKYCSRVRLRRVATRSGLMRKRLVFVVAAPPDARLVTPLGGAVEPLIHAPEAVQSARIGGIGVVDDAVLEHERAHARPLARIRGRVGAGHGSERSGPVGCRARGYLGLLAAR